MRVVENGETVEVQVARLLERLRSQPAGTRRAWLDEQTRAVHVHLARQLRIKESDGFRYKRVAELADEILWSVGE